MRQSIWLLTILASLFLVSPLSTQSLPGTKPLQTKADFAKVMVEGIGKYLDRETAGAVKKRTALWRVDRSSPEKFEKSIATQRDRLKRIMGLVDKRLPIAMEYVTAVNQPAVIAESKDYKVYAVRWSVLPGVDGEGLLAEPVAKAKESIIIVPDADFTPETVLGLAPGLPPHYQALRIFTSEIRRGEALPRIIVPVLIDRTDRWSGNPKIGRMTNQPHREFVYRMSYQTGRHILGYELQRILALVDWIHEVEKQPQVTVIGFGEGGLLSLLSAALDGRIADAAVIGCFRPREAMWDEPIYRNLWGFLREFGDAELAAMSRTVRIIHEPWPKVDGPPAASKDRRGAAPGGVRIASFEDAKDEFARIAKIDESDGKDPKTGFPIRNIGIEVGELRVSDAHIPKDNRINFDPAPRQKRQFDQLVDYTQKLLPEASAKRQAFFWNKLNTSSLEKLQKSQQPLRDYFWEEIIGKLPKSELPMNPRTRLIYDTPRFKGYEVVLDLYEDVICHGILLVPNDIKPGEKRPVVVCQHGLEGRATDVCDPTKRTKYYNSFGAQLAERGYVVFAPQNPYIFGNEFRQLVRKANPLKLTLYSFIVRQHERILDWLCTLPFVDPARIAYYGLSYGGKVAMRIPVLLGRYCLVVCSGDFNEWIWKNITLDWAGSYMFTGEYEMFEFDLANTFNYAEMAALIAPRPFMVERGHNDGVGLDEYVAFEYAKVRRFYAKLGIPERTEIEFFQGGHEINGQGTFRFLDRHLNWTPR